MQLRKLVDHRVEFESLTALLLSAVRSFIALWECSVRRLSKSNPVLQPFLDEVPSDLSGVSAFGICSIRTDLETGLISISISCLPHKQEGWQSHECPSQDEHERVDHAVGYWVGAAVSVGRAHGCTAPC